MRVVAILVWAMTAVTAHAYDFLDSKGIAYNINTSQNTATVTFKTADYNNYSGKVDIPATISVSGKSYRVVEVGDNAFRNCSGLNEVTLGVNVTSIGKRAFLACSSLKQINIPANVTNLGDYAFADCSTLQKVIMNNLAPITLGTGAFMRCTALTTVDWAACSTLEGHGGLTELGTNAFAGCTMLQQLLLPGNVQYMGNSIFDGCIRLQSLTVMADEPFAVNGDPFSLDKAKTTIYVPRGIEAGEVAASYSASIGWRDYNIVELGYSFLDQNKFTYCKVGNNTVALTGCQNSVISVDVRRTITGYNGDEYGVVAIGNGAFKASVVKTLNTSNALKLQSIGEEAFAGCGQLKQVTLVEGLSVMGANAFKGCLVLSTIKLPSTLRVVPQGAFRGCSALTQVQLIHGLQEIDSLAFAGCTSLKTIYLPRSLARVKPRAFVGDNKLESFSVDPMSTNFVAPDGVLIELANSYEYPSEDMGKMKRVIAYPVAKLDANYYCPYDVYELAPYAFENATHLKYLALPATVTSLVPGCFASTSLEKINCRAIEPIEVKSNAFSGINVSTVLLQVPEEATDAYKNAPVWKGFKNIEGRYDVSSSDEFAFDWDSEGKVVMVGIKPAAVHDGTLSIPDGVTLSGVYYPAVSLKNTATTGVASLVKTLNLSSDNLSNIDTSNGINPLAALTALQTLTLSATNQAFSLNNGVLTSANGSQIYYYLRSNTANSYTLDSKVETVMPQAFARNAHLQQLVSNSKLREIGIGAFENCSKLSSVDNATSLTKINERAFKSCPLSTFNGGDKLVEIGDEAFAGCTSLKSFPFSHGMLKNIGNQAFKGCTSLKCVVVNSTTKTIGDNVFEGCSSLEKVYFFDEVSFGQEVFKGCPALSNMWLNNDTPPVVDHTTFEGNNLQAHALWVPVESVNAYRAHPVWGRFGTINCLEYIDNGGDVNGDGYVNAVDITMLYNIILGLGSSDIDADSGGHCDVNHDGVINSSDVTLVYNYILYDIELNSTYKFVNQENKHVNQTISMNASHEIVTAHNMKTNQDVVEGFTIVTDNPQVLNVNKVTQNGIPRYELIPVSKGYATLVFMVDNEGISYYHELPIKVIQ